MVRSEAQNAIDAFIQALLMLDGHKRKRRHAFGHGLGNIVQLLLLRQLLFASLFLLLLLLEHLLEVSLNHADRVIEN